MKNIIKAPNIMMPNEKVDMTKWAVVACDQFTSQPEYSYITRAVGRRYENRRARDKF